jgi:predicted nucleic acid-binding protein
VKLVVDASVGLKWVLREDDSELADHLLTSGHDLLVPDFWLNEATNALWVQVRRRLMTGDAARQGLAMLRSALEPAATQALSLHEAALDVSLAVGVSPHDALYAAFACDGGRSRDRGRPAVPRCAAPAPRSCRGAAAARPAGVGERTRRYIPRRRMKLRL